MSEFVPDRGDIVWLEFSPQRGHEQAGSRPAMVLSPKRYNQKSGLALMCPITSKVKNYPFEVRIKSQDIDGVILADQLRSLDWHERRAALIEKAPLAAITTTQQLLDALIRG